MTANGDRKMRGFWLECARVLIEEQLPEPKRTVAYDRLGTDGIELLAKAEPKEWYPLADVVRVLDAISSTEQDSEAIRALLVKYGRAMGGGAAKTYMKLFVNVADLGMMLRQMPVLWDKYASFGKFSGDILEAEKFVCTARGIEGWRYQPAVGEGWLRSMMEFMKKRNIAVALTPDKPVLDPAEGQTSWTVTWNN